MELVVDANVIFSALVRDSHARHLLLINDWTLYIPEFLFDEIAKHEEEILQKTSITSLELKDLLNTILLASSIKVMPKSEFKSFLEKAAQISPDPDDIQYFALALYKKCAIWSNDKRLKEQNTIKIYATHELS